MFVLNVIVFISAIIIKVQAACITPNNERAECVSLYSCRALFNSQANREFVRQSNCGGTPAEPKVCCGTKSNFTKAATKEKQKPLTLKDLLPENKFCGLQHSDDFFHTTNATVVTEFPWLAFIEYRKTEVESVSPSSRRFRCSGSLINTRYVLTTAGCLTDRHEQPVGVRLGEHHASNETDCIEDSQLLECSDPVEYYDIEKIIYHPEFIIGSISPHDIGLIRLNTTVFFTDYIRPICLPLPGTKTVNAGDIVITTGWGVLPTYEYSETKKRTQSELISNIKCDKMYVNEGARISLEDGQMCGLNSDNTSELLCRGDAGSPVSHSYKNQWYQEGIISLGSCLNYLPSIYTNVRHYLSWIEENLEP